MPPLSLTQSKYAFVVLPMSVKSVPGCLTLMPPSLIGSPVAFLPLPSPHFEAATALESWPEAAGVLDSLSLLESLTFVPHADAPVMSAIAAAIAMLVRTRPPRIGTSSKSDITVLYTAPRAAAGQHPSPRHSIVWRRRCAGGAKARVDRQRAPDGARHAARTASRPRLLLVGQEDVAVVELPSRVEHGDRAQPALAAQAVGHDLDARVLERARAACGWPAPRPRGRRGRDARRRTAPSGSARPSRTSRSAGGPRGGRARATRLGGVAQPPAARTRRARPSGCSASISAPRSIRSPSAPTNVAGVAEQLGELVAEDESPRACGRRRAGARRPRRACSAWAMPTIGVMPMPAATSRYCGRPCCSSKSLRGGETSSAAPG